MKPELESSPAVWPKVIGSAVLGAAAMYIFDPVRGRRRRAIAQDKAVALVNDACNLVNAAARDLTFRARGLGAEARRRLRHETGTDDLVVIERVRSKLGRVVSHPHAIHVGAEHGRVMLSGPILTYEIPSLLLAVRSVPGVVDVEEHLVAYDRADSIPSLQGGPRRLRRTGENWSPALRVAAIAGGGALAVCGLRQRGVTGAALAVIGLGLTARGARNNGRLRHARERAGQAVSFE